MKFTIEIELGNAAMKTYDDIADAIRAEASNFSATIDPKIGDGNKICVFNGNTVGKWEVTDTPSIETSPLDDSYRETAKEQYVSEGQIEIDDNAIVSVSDDDGAYVAAWVWVQDSDIEQDEDEDHN